MAHHLDQTSPPEDGHQTQTHPPEALQEIDDLLPSIHKPSSQSGHLPQTTSQRQTASTTAQSLDQDTHLPEKVSDLAGEDVKKSVLYLAYGSNLASKTFLGRRGIKPLSQINVYVPELRLTFDLPGLPYAEPCFAATRFRRDDEPEDTIPVPLPEQEKEPLLQNDPVDSVDGGEDYHKERWHKPLIGVVYEVSLPDYARIIATEGGGRGYKDMVVSCHPFPDEYDPSDPVPAHPHTTPFNAHTLLSPAAEKALRGDPGVRPNPAHAQPSARYLGLVNAGAEEHALPFSYRRYLSQIRPYRITTFRQRVGKGLFLVIWAPLILSLLGLSRCLAGPDGRSPGWLNNIADAVYRGMWWCYDAVFLGVFGEGERTIGDT